jgi:hypothetical protein
MPLSNAVTIGAAEEKPSSEFHWSGSIGTPSMFVGSAPFAIATRRPVAVVASSTS